MLETRIAQPEDFETVEAFYRELIGTLEGAKYTPQWKVGIYPSAQQLRDAIDKNTLIIGENGGRVVACMVLDRHPNDSYRDVPWPTAASDEQVSIIHLLGVKAGCSGQGIGAQMVRTALRMAREAQQKAVRLDVLAGNLPAEKLYEKEGFRKVCTQPTYYDDTGWIDCGLYECAL